ncbi:hypothetical protein [Abyssalbus ytuae]|uniref:Uncharacterized protein n=1 Tax=Abyssalbus ytuae TaxID=2926907 RepID=A0A9E7D2R0_9FLAO|nr:hypothetical protein [Abyssalbus ytuae]UOB18428.1 hypothetical protein MQE35_03850 [Abyssalbus ytuae]
MKTCIIIIFFLKGIMISAQMFPLLTDPGSITGTKLMSDTYKDLKYESYYLAGDVNKFNNNYRKRALYLTTMSSFLTNKINREIKLSMERYNFLVSRNKSLSLLNYSKKKKNLKMLKLIEKMLNNLENELSKQKSINVLNGEKLNLYHNVMESLWKIDQVMDTVEDNVKQSIILDFITRRK